MIKLENIEVTGWEVALRGMRNPMNSWDKSDSAKGCSGIGYCPDCSYHDDCDEDPNRFTIGDKDHELMMKLAQGGAVHAKYRRMIIVSLDILAPLYWWKEFDTYKVGVIANSCSTMHKIHEKELTIDDFSHEHLFDGTNLKDFYEDTLRDVIRRLNRARAEYLNTNDKRYWWQMIQLLPSSYNQRRTVMLNYEVLTGIYNSRKDHKLDEWRMFCDMIEQLPYSEIITGKIV